MRAYGAKSRLLLTLIGTVMNRRDLADVLPAGSWPPTIVAAAAIVAVFGILDIVHLLPR